MKEALRRILSIVLLVNFCFFLSKHVKAEGTREIMPAATDTYYLLFNRGGGLNVPFGLFTPNTVVYQPGTTSVDYRYNIRVCAVGERVRFGFRSNSSNTFYRIRRQSDDAIVFGPVLIPSAAGEGFINTYAEAVAGPRSIVGATGYNDTGFVAGEIGDYYIEFNRGNNTTYLNNEFTMRFFDITVTTAGGAVRLGRTWSKAWQFADGGSAFRGNFFVYADDGIVTRLNSNGMQPYWFSISCNATGVSNTGNPNVDRRSVPGARLYPQYRIFLNDPDINCYPTGTFGNLLSDPTITGCGTNRCINMNVDKAGNILVTLDLNGTPGFQPGTIDRQISFLAAVGMNCIPWDGLDGQNNNVPTGTNITVQVDYLNGITHLPLYDCEDNQNGFIVTLVRPAGPSPRLFWDDSNVIPASYGAGSALDGITNLTGCNNATGCHRWRGRGSNNCPPCSETLNTWWYANIVTRSINYVNTNVFVDANNLTPGTGYVGNNFNACAQTSPPIQLNGTISGPAGVTGQWISSGTGTFSPSNTALNATYTPSADDITNGTVQIKLQSVGGVCPPVLDSMIITLQVPPSVFAGATKSVCRNNGSPVPLSDATRNATTAAVQWTGGAGTFTPNRTSLNPTYTPSSGERTAGTPVVLTLRGSGAIGCPNSVSTVTFTFYAAPTANAGGNRTVCANNATVTLPGTVSAGATPAWTSVTTGCSSCFANAASANTTYTPSAADIAAGSIQLRLTASLAGCNNVTSNMTLTISAAPTANAGPNQSICRNNTTATLAGAVTNATSRTWSASNGCAACFSSLTSLTPTFTPTAAYLASNSSVTLTLTAARAGCNNVTSSMTITYTDIPVVDAGPPSTNFCSDNPQVQLNGTVTGATGGIWSGGTGTFITSTTDLNALYNLSPAEVSLGVVALFLTSTGNGNCNPVRDSIALIRRTPPTVNVTIPPNVCRNNPSINISGTISGVYSTSQWTSTSSGTAGFANPAALSTTYTLNATDLANGTVTLRLAANSIDPLCAPTIASGTTNVIEPPIVSAGADQTGICFNPGTVSLNGASSTGSGTWTGGAGTFSPNANTLNATYNSTAGERGGTVTLTFTSTANGLCNAVADQMQITFAQQITVNAGTPITICSNNAIAQLNGASPETGTALWSGGAGTFSPNANTLNATYTPTAAEITAGSVVLTLTATGTGICTAPTSTVTITISPAPVIAINGGAASANVCADNPTTNLSVTLPGSLGVIWTGGAGTYSPNNSTASITYTATATEITNGTVTLTATTTNNGLCNAVTDVIDVVIAPRPTVNAGSDQVLCGSTPSVSLNGVVTGATGGSWTSSGSGSFGSASSVNTSYTPSAADRTVGLVTLTLTSTGNGTCTAVTDQLIITFTVVPTINAGPDVTVCENTLPAQLNGAGSPATWSGGAGTFGPNNAAMNATYNPTAAEVTAGTVTLTLTTNASGACPQVSDQVTITILPSPLANAGTDATICGNATSFPINGSVNAQATGGFWTTTGSGTIASPTSLSTTYTPSAADRAAGSVTLTLTTVGNGSCNPHSDNIVYTISAPVTVFAGPDQTLCQGSGNISLSGVITGATGGTWSIVSGLGTINNPTSATTASYTPNIADVSVTLQLTTTGNPAGCTSLTDDITITLSPAPTVMVGPNQTVCGDVTSVALTGTVTNAAGGVWSTTGAGSFTPNNTTLNTSYVPATNETGTFTFTLTSTGNGVCAATSANMTVTITPRPTVNAGIDRTVCANNAAITLTGTVTSATGGLWTTLGTGAFSAVSGDGLTVTYTPSAADIALGAVSLRLTTTGVGTCTPVSDMMVLIITPAPIVNAGPDRSICANNRPVNLAGTTTVTNGTGAWTTLGTGTFSAVSTNGLNATYTASNADTTGTPRTVRLVLTSTNNGLCNAVTDTMDVAITPAPVVQAGPDMTICADSFFVRLDANFYHASAGIWSTTGTGSFFNSNATFDTAVYVPSPADRTAGVVTLRFTTTVHGACNPVSDDLVLAITQAPTVDAGLDQQICSDGASINLSGIRNSIPTGSIWTTSGDGTFDGPTNPNSTLLNATYFPRTADRASGTVVLTLTSTGNGTCRAAFDQLILTIVPKPIVNVGLDQTVCADIYNTGALLNPSVLHATTVTWTTSGSGAFDPTANTLNARYFPSVADTISKTVTLTLTADGNSPCTPTSDDLVMTINPIPVVNAGVDQEVCKGSNATLNGRILHASGGVWTTSGTGTFAPDANALNATYIPSTADTTGLTASVTLTLTSTGMGTCNAVTDQMVINFRNLPTVNAGIDDTICADGGSFGVAGIVTNASGGVWSSSSGGGFFPLNNVNTIYFPTTQDSLSGQVVLTLTTTGMGNCAAVSDNILLTISPIPTADAGPPSLNICITANTVNLNGTVTNATGAYWASLGDGTFDNQDILNPVYTFGPGDKTAGTVLLTMISQGNGACLFYTDSIRINFTTTTNVNAGPNRTICRTDFPITLQGSGTNGIWSGGTLAQFSDINSLNSTYTPTPAESALGTLTLTLTAIDACAGPPSNVTFTFIDGPSVTVNPLTTICTNVSTINLSGIASSTGIWTSTGSGSYADNTNINTTYTVSAGDRISGLIRFTYTIPATGFCNARRDTASIRINPTPTVSAGPDQTRCSNALTAVSMNGTFSIASGVNWYTINGSNSVTNPTNVNATYTPVGADVGATPIRMVIETTGNGFCSVQRDTMLINITPAPTALIGSDTTMCADKVAMMSATRTVASGGVWSSTGTGTFSPNNMANTVVYTPSQADTTAGNVTIQYLTTGNGICSAVNVNKQITLTRKPLIGAGIDDTICSGQFDVDLPNAFVANAPTVLWTTTGSGTFTPSATSLNARYVPSATDKANGGAIIRLASTGVTECDSVFDYKTLIIIPSPVASVNAGFDQTICRDESFAQLAGFIIIATGAKWDCAGSPCSGTFLPNDEDLFAQYLPSATDTANGIVTLRLTTTSGNGICDPVFDEMTLTIIDIPRVDAGMRQTVCADTAYIQLNGAVSHATLTPQGYSWTSTGGGIFAPNAFVANPIYIPTALDKFNGEVGFTLTSTNNGTCQPYSDTVTARILPPPTINAGIDRATCANVPSVVITGTMTNSSAAVWTTSGTGTPSFPGNGLVNTYSPSALDDTSGLVILTITTAPGATGSCRPVSDQMFLTINQAPTVSAGVDRTICADNNNVAIGGTINRASGALWTAVTNFGSGTFANNTGLSTTYRPSPQDTARGEVRLVLTTTGNGLCLPEDDTINILIDPIPVVNPGSAIICTPTNGSALNGTILHAGGGLWSSSGTGTFAVNAATLNATYFPSSADITAGNVVLTLTSTANGQCNAVSRTTNLQITRIPVANAGPDQFVCINAATSVSASLDANGSRYEWSRLNGTIVSANATSINLIADKDTSFVLTVYDFKNCASVRDTVNIRTFTMPTLALSGTACFTDSNRVNSTSIPAPPVPGTYQWFNNSSILTGQNTTTISPVNTGSYVLTFSYGGCVSTSPPFAVNPSPVVGGIDKTNCVNNVTTLGTSGVSGGTTFSYAWTGPPTILGATNTSQLNVQTNLVFDTLSYNVRVTNNFSCFADDSVYLISIASPILDLENDTLCENQTTTLVANATNFNTGSIPPIDAYFPTYTWTRDGVNLNNNSNTQPVTQPGRYIVNITIGDCNNNGDTSDVIYNRFAVFNIPDNEKVCLELDSAVTINATAQPAPGFTFTYLWSPTNETTPSIQATNEGNYTVTVTSTVGSNSCPVTDSTFIRNLCAPRVFVPNVFTPDKDGNSKVFRVFGDHFTDYEITVFNRWGEVIFSSKDPGEGWDGTYRGKEMPVGVYPYIIKYDGEADEYKGPYRKEGEILIIR